MICKHLSVFGFSLFVASVLTPLPSLAHNTIIEYQATEAIAIEAKFDDGTPLSNAQVVVYAPDNPNQAWQKGITDDQGKFSFIPDYKNKGNWTVKVRLAGHGDVINIPINASNIQNPSASLSHSETISSSLSLSHDNAQLSLRQKLMMAMMGSWGFVGTALFFSRKNKIVN